MSARRAIVTGAAGFIGRNLTIYLREHGWSVLPIDNLAIPPSAAPPPGLLRKDVLDLRESDFSGVDAVVHLAAYKSVPLSFSSRDDMARNVIQDRHVLEMVTNAAVPRVLLASSCEVFGRSGNQAKLGECESYNPMSPYAVSKVAMEYLANVYRMLGSGTNLTCVRFFNTYGPDEGKDAVIPRFIDDISRHGRLTIEGDGQQRRDFSYIDDVVIILGELLLRDVLPEAINIGSGVSWSIKEIADMVLEAIGRGEIQHTKARSNEIMDFCCDNRLLNELMNNHMPSTPVDIGIANCVARTLSPSSGTNDALVDAMLGA